MDLQTFQDRVFPVKNKLFRFAFRLLGSSDDAKDVVQEVLIKVWNGREQLDQIQNMEAWCMRVTRNLSLDRLRAQQRRPEESIERGLYIQHDAHSPLDSVELSESMKRISELMASLPEKQRQVMHLRDVEGYSYQEIADILELDMNQVKVNLFRARQSVREQLQKISAYGLS